MKEIACGPIVHAYFGAILLLSLRIECARGGIIRSGLGLINVARVL